MSVSNDVKFSIVSDSGLSLSYIMGIEDKVQTNTVSK